jgi:integrase
MKPVEDIQNRTETGQTTGQTKSKSKRARLSKTHVDYWKKRLKRRSFVGRDGVRVEVPELQVRMFHAGRESWFNLHSTNVDSAATKARDIFLSLVAAGWEPTLARFRPDLTPKKRVGTVGEALAVAKALAVTRPQSFAQAALRLRQMAGELEKIKPPRHRTAYMSEKFKGWREKIDAVPLTVFTADKVREWRARRIAARADNDVEKRAATISANSTIRMARAVFSKKILVAGLGSKVELPTPLPFAGVTVGGSTKRFAEKIDPVKLLASARADLETSHPEQFRAFSLCIMAGLRRSEADRLTWAQIDLAGATLTIERTEYFEPKSEESAREVALEPVVVNILRRAKADNPDPVFVLKGGEYRRQLKAATYYRCDASPWRTWRNLSAWLSEHGIKDGKPIHVLRKLAGSLVFTKYGLEQARGFLGHKSVTTTSSSYLAKANRITVSIGEPADEFSAAQAKTGAAKGVAP